MLYYLVTILLFVLFVDWWKRRDLMKLHRQLGTEWTFLPIIGHAYKFIGSNEDVFKAFTNGASQAHRMKNGSTSIWLGNKLIIGIGDPLQSIGVLKTAFDKSFIHRFLTYLLGDGIVIAPVETWHRRRKILSPTFATRYVSKYVSVFQQNSKTLVELLEQEVGNGNFSSWNYVTRYALDSVCETILDSKTGALKQADNTYFDAFQECFKSGGSRVAKPWLHIDAIYKCLPVYARLEKAKKIIYEFVDNIIQSNKKKVAIETKNADEENNGRRFKIFLDLMIESSKETGTVYTDKELREESLTLIFAGTDTSATAACFTLVLLSQHQDVQDKVYQELEEVLGDINRPIVYEDLLKLKYTEAVIKETLRLYPPLPLIVRDSKKDFELPSGVTIPKNCDVITNIYGIQRHPKYWGDDADEFKPERFLSEQTSSSVAFMAFSSGPRNCIGQSFAMLSLKTTLASILGRYRLLPATSFKYDQEHPLRLTYEIMLKHVDNFEIQIDYRNKLKRC